MFSLMATMRGTKEYYSKLGMEIRWMMRHTGPSTLFITVVDVLMLCFHLQLPVLSDMVVEHYLNQHKYAAGHSKLYDAGSVVFVHAANANDSNSVFVRDQVWAEMKNG